MRSIEEQKKLVKELEEEMNLAEYGSIYQYREAYNRWTAEYLRLRRMEKGEEPCVN